VDDAARTLPALDFFAIFVAVVGFIVAVELTDQTWLLPVGGWMVALGLVVSGAHWRADYLREVKENIRGATMAKLAIVAAFLILGFPIVWPVITHVKSSRLEIGTILPYTQGFLGWPLSSCGDPGCSISYTSGPYTPSIMYSVLDHSLKQDANGLWQYGTGSRSGGNGVIIAFNGESASGPRSERDRACIGGILHIAPAQNVSDMVVHPSPCGTGFASYDESIGYDFRAAMDTPVQAAAEGIVIKNGGTTCIVTNIPSCGAFNFIGIDHGNGYISQYGYLSTISVKAGDRVRQGDQIGRSGNKGTTSPQLHFEVLRLIPGRENNYAAKNYAVVDPYGWVARGIDPLYSVRLGIPSQKLWQ
jgi:hypothetical protein